MSSSDDGDSDPKFSRQTRIRVAISKYHGLDGETWNKQEIADFLNVRKNTVNKYLNDSQLAKDTEHALVEKEAQTRLSLIQQLHQKLDRLDTLEEKISNESEAVPTSFDLKRNQRAEIDFENVPNVDAPEEGAPLVDIDVPVPSEYEEMPNLDKLEKIWREKRLVQEQLEDLLGLESPDELDVDQNTTVDVKYWKTDDDLPDQEVIDVNAEDPLEGELPDADTEEV